jgi:hypothetical protein
MSSTIVHPQRRRRTRFNTPATFRTKWRKAAIASTAAIAGGLGSYAVFDGHASAVPIPQEVCRFGFSTITSELGWRPLGLGVTINNGTVARRVITQLAADIGVVSGAEVRVGYAIDGGPVREKVYGPGNLANHTEFWETRQTIAVIPLGAGFHTVQPYWRISGDAGKAGFFEGGCFTAEGQTR